MPPSTAHLKPFQFKKKYSWDEPCTERVSFRVPKSMKKLLDLVDGNYAEFIRQAIEEKLDNEGIKEKELSKYEKPNNKGLRTGKEKTSYKVENEDNI